MIEIMKACHQELEVTDMTGIAKAPPTSSYSLYGSSASVGMAMPAAPARSGARGMAAGSSLRGLAMMSDSSPSYGSGAMMGACAAPAMVMCAAPAMAMESSGMDDLEARLRALDGGPSYSMKASAPVDESKEVFRSAAVASMSKQVMKVQAKKRAKLF